jgi:hypothetical protein
LVAPVHDRMPVMLPAAAESIGSIRRSHRTDRGWSSVHVSGDWLSRRHDHRARFIERLTL